MDLALPEFYVNYFSVSVLVGFSFSIGVMLVGYSIKKAIQTFIEMSK